MLPSSRGGARRWGRRLGGVAVSGLLVSAAVLVIQNEPAAASESLATIAPTSWAYIDSLAPDTSFVNPSGEAPIGKIHFDDSGNHVYRSYFTFDISQFLSPRQISSVVLHDAETNVPHCVDRSAELWTTTPIIAHTTWNHPPTEQTKVATVTYVAGSSPCPVPYMSLDATAIVQQALAAGQTQLTFELRESDEQNPHQGRWLGNQPWLLFSYDTPPDTPTPLDVDGKPCATAAPYPWVSNLQPTLYARPTDPDVADYGSLSVTFALWPISDPTHRTLVLAPNAASGQTVQRPLPSGVVADGGSYGWSVQTTDAEGLTSSWSTPCYFQVDVTRPANPPGVSSSDYPSDSTWHGGQGIPGIFTFTANGVSDIVGYTYGWNGYAQGGYVAADELGGSATVALAPPRPVNDLAVASVDRAGNQSPPTIYRFDATPTAPIVNQVGQPKAGGSTEIDLRPGVTIPGYEVVSYTYKFNGGSGQTVAARPDGTATVMVTPVYGFNSVAVTSTSVNGWVSTETDESFYADNSPTVASPDFPENGTGGTAGQPGTFTFTSNLAGSTDFYYSFDYGSTFQTVPVGGDGTATISWTADVAVGAIYVYSQTADGTQSDWYFYNFSVNP